MISEAVQALGRKSDSLTLVVVSKQQPIQAIQTLYDLGHRDFGENRVDELLEKHEALPKDIRWHFIGTLQRKKVPKIIDKCHLIHAVDTPQLAEKLSACAEDRSLKIPILLQSNVSGEETKHGLSPQQWGSELARLQNLPGLDIQGLMTMAPMAPEEEVRRCFAGLRELLTHTNLTLPHQRHLSMGMSSDWLIAVEEGATIVRVGSLLFEGVF